MKKFSISFIISFFCFCLMTFQTNAQLSAKGENAQLLKKSILAVVKFEPDAGEIKKLKKENKDIAEYEKAIEQANVYMQEVVNDVWTLSKGIEFVSEAQAEKIRLTKDPNYCILSFEKQGTYNMGDFYDVNDSRYKTEANRRYHLTNFGVSRAFVLKSASEGMIAKSFFPPTEFSKAYVLFTIQFLKAQVEASFNGIDSPKKFEDETEKRNALLKDKILLISDPFVSKPLERAIENNNMGKHYSYPFERVESSKVEEAILNKDGKYAFLCTARDGFAFQGGAYYSHFIVDAKDCSILYFTKLTAAPYNHAFVQLHFEKISKAIDK